MHAIDDMLVVQALLKADQTGLDKSVIQQQASPRVVGFWGVHHQPLEYVRRKLLSRAFCLKVESTKAMLQNLDNQIASKRQDAAKKGQQLLGPCVQW